MHNRRDLLKYGVAAGALAAAPSGAGAAPASAFHDRLDRLAETLLAARPETATQLGLDNGARSRLASRLDDKSPAADRALLRDLADARRDVAAVDRGRLTPADQIRYDTMLFALDNAATGASFGYGRPEGFGGLPYAVTQQNGSYQGVPEFLDSAHRLAAPADVDAYLARLDAFGTQLDQETAKVEADAARGVIAPDFLLATTLRQMTALRSKPAGEQRMVTALAKRVARGALGADPTQRATAIVEGRVYPALERQIAALQRVATHATADAGMWKLPDGERYYAWQLRSQTTTELTAATIHATGLRQNGELEAEMDGVLKRLGMTQGTVGERMAALTADPQYAFPNTDEGRAAAVDYVTARIAAIRPRLASLSKLGLKAEVQVKRVPADIQDGAALGYMNFAAVDGSRPAIYYINLKDTSYWPKWTIPSLTAHEAIPGHAWQGAYLAEHRAELPLITQLLQFNAFVEGWALYAEQSVDESGLYADDPLARLGYLQAQRFRAVRLVVDTGLHAMRWTRARAIDFMVANTGRARGAVTSEIDRYCASPGQACGYKIGHNEILRLRARAQTALGAKFDVRDFNDALVRTGGVPLTVLGTVVDQQIAAARRA